MEEKEDKNDDPRVEFIYQYLLRSSKIKPDKWAKMLATEDLKVINLSKKLKLVTYNHEEVLTKILWLQNVIMNFFGSPEEYILTVNVSSSGGIVPALGIQSNVRNKLSYFVKRQPVIITETNYRELLIPGDMSPKPVDELSILVQEVSQN